MPAIQSNGGATSTATTPIDPVTSVSQSKSSTSGATSSSYPTYAAHIPFSMRRAPPLDMSTVERNRHHSSAGRETAKRVRPHGLQEAPTFRPTEEEFKDPLEYMRRISAEGRKYGICKIIPPDHWKPDFAIDTEVSILRLLHRLCQTILWNYFCSLYFVCEILSTVTDEPKEISFPYTASRAQFGRRQ